MSRTYLYIAAKQDGLVNVTRPRAPVELTRFTADGQINDAEDVTVASTNASLFAYIADGRNGVRVVQLMSPETQRNFYGFSPVPVPELIAWARTPTPALAMSKGIDRDRAVDETGGQIAVFGRLGSRPFNRIEMERLFLTRGGGCCTAFGTAMRRWSTGAGRWPRRRGGRGKQSILEQFRCTGCLTIIVTPSFSALLVQ